MPVRSDPNPRTWVRKLDGDLHIVPEQPQERLYPVSRDELLSSVRKAITPPLGFIPQARVIGSHWGISKVGVTPGYMIETATPVHEQDGDQAAGRLNEPLFEVIPECLSAEALRFFISQHVPTFNPNLHPTHQEFYLVHVEAGMRIHELYALLDDDALKRGRSLATKMKAMNTPGDYSGPWALETMGGAGGQTIVGAMSTGTHGGDVNFGPLGESVLAVHLIDARGEEYWIERTQLTPSKVPWTLVDEIKLKGVYPHIKYRRDDDLLNAVVVACGRMGAIYSVVLRAVRQFALEETCVKRDWETDVKTWINGSGSMFATRFLRVDINPYGTMSEPISHTCYVIRRYLSKLDAAGSPMPLGRELRGLAPNIGTQRALGHTKGFTTRLCGSDDWVHEAIDALLEDVKDARDTAVTIWLACAAVIVFWLTPPPVRQAALAVQATAASVIVATTLMIVVLTDIIEDVLSSAPGTFGDTMAVLVNFLAHNDLFAILRFVTHYGYESEHTANADDPRSPAISYAVMDEHDYQNIGCVAPGDSIELFFDASDPNLVSFIDKVLARVRELENGTLSGQPEAIAGYISLRFMTASPAPIAMQRWPLTCSVEIAGLSRVEGVAPFLRQVEADAVQHGAILHWGQRNNWTMKNVEKAYNPMGPSGSLFKWREALSEVTEHGRYDVFSTAFSKQMGLEITKPIIRSFAATPTEFCAGDTTTVSWDALSNPPETKAFLLVIPKQGNPVRTPLPGLQGTYELAPGAGEFTLRLELERELNFNFYSDTRDLSVRGIAPQDEWAFSFIAEPRFLDGMTRWIVEINLYSQMISNALRVTGVTSGFSGISAWTMRHPDIADVQFTSAQTIQPIAGLPVFNKNWLFFSKSPVAPGPAPTLKVIFELACQP